MKANLLCLAMLVTLAVASATLAQPPAPATQVPVYAVPQPWTPVRNLVWGRPSPYVVALTPTGPQLLMYQPAQYVPVQQGAQR